MPKTGLEVMVIKRRISTEEWDKMIKSRYFLLKEHLNNFTLPTLGELCCLRHGTNEWHDLNQDSPKTLVGFSDTAPTCIDLKTQGIFLLSKDTYIQSTASGVYYAWGLTRRCKWIKIEIKFIGEAGYKGRGYQRCDSVTVSWLKSYTRIVNAHEISPQKIWISLGNMINLLIERRKKLYEEILPLANIVQTENQILEIVTK